MAEAGSAGIVGAGLMGRLMAWRLALAGWQVTLFDKGERSAHACCTWKGAGMIAPWAELEHGKPVVHQLGLQALRLWPQWLPQLPKPVFYQQRGSLVVAHRQDAGDLAHFQNLVAKHLSDDQGLQSIDGEAIATLEPELGRRFNRGLFFAAEGQIEPRDLIPALDAALADLGARWYFEQMVTAVEPGCLTTEIRYSFDLVIDCRGLGAKPNLPLRGVRGELLRLYGPGIHLRRPIRLMHPRYPLYVVPRPNHTFLVGATSIESEHEGPVTVRSSLELLSAAYSLHAGFAEAEVVEQVVGLRPALPGNLPSIHYQPGLMRINGLYRHGFLAAPPLVTEAMALIQNQTVNFPSLLEVSDARING